VILPVPYGPDYSMRGPDADPHAKLLIDLAMEGHSSGLTHI
jgi:hypothetical protein